MHKNTLFIIYVIFVMKIIDSNPVNAKCNCTREMPRIAKFKNLILKRRTRGVIFPDKTNVLISPCFTKAIIDGRPRGLSYSIEFDVYHPLPDTVDGWTPTILVKKLKKEEALKQKENTVVTPPPPPAIMVPAPAVRVYNETLPYFPIIANGIPGHFDNVYSHPYEHYHFPVDDDHNYAAVDGDTWHPIVDRNYHMPKYKHEHFHQSKPARKFYRNNYKSFHNNSWPNYNTAKKFHTIPTLKQPKHPTSASEHQDYYKYNAENGRNSKYFENDERKYSYNDKWSIYWPEEEVYESAEDVPKWKYHQGYRERREIFKQLEAVGKIFNFNMKACIQRAMCEVTTHLKPYGESLMEDIVRIILSIPTDPDFDDEYSDKTHNRRGMNCKLHFAVSCPYAVMDILTKNLNLAELVKKS